MDPGIATVPQEYLPVVIQKIQTTLSIREFNNDYLLTIAYPKMDSQLFFVVIFARFLTAITLLCRHSRHMVCGTCQGYSL